jgi:hypothetical protein
MSTLKVHRKTHAAFAPAGTFTPGDFAKRFSSEKLSRVGRFFVYDSLQVFMIIQRKWYRYRCCFYVTLPLTGVVNNCIDTGMLFKVTLTNVGDSDPHPDQDPAPDPVPDPSIVKQNY